MTKDLSTSTYKICSKKHAGFVSIFLVIIITSVILASLAMIEVSSMYAGKSISKNLCAVSGRSVLSEYNIALFTRYGIFAVKNDENFLEEKFSFYISNSLKSRKSIIHLKCTNIDINPDNYKFDEDEILRQIDCIDNDLTNYIMSNFSNEMNPLDNCKNNLEVERILYGFQSDELNRAALKTELTTVLTAMHFAFLMNNIDVPDENGKTLRSKLGEDLDENETRSAVIGIATSMAIEDIETLYQGKSINFEKDDVEAEYSYEDFLRHFLKLSLKRILAKHMMAVMEININEVEKSAFSFSSSCYGFDVSINVIKETVSVFDGFYNPRIQVSQSVKYL